MNNVASSFPMRLQSKLSLSLSLSFLFSKKSTQHIYTSWYAIITHSIHRSDSFVQYIWMTSGDYLVSKSGAIHLFYVPDCFKFWLLWVVKFWSSWLYLRRKQLKTYRLTFFLMELLFLRGSVSSKQPLLYLPSFSTKVSSYNLTKKDSGDWPEGCTNGIVNKYTTNTCLIIMQEWQIKLSSNMHLGHLFLPTEYSTSCQWVRYLLCSCKCSLWK